MKQIPIKICNVYAVDQVSTKLIRREVIFNMKNLKENKPTADILMNSMRAMGYSFESAIADIIDNSISSGARTIQLRFPISPLECYVVICDDGCGMSREELFDAMKSTVYKGLHRVGI